MKTTTEAEIWKPIPGQPEYEASDMGRIASVKFGKFRVLRPRLRTGYPVATLTHGGHQKQHSVHRLILETFSGPALGRHGSHLNNDRSDNRPCNLIWESVSENNQRKHQHGTMAHGERHGAAKLTEEQVLAIRAEYVPGSISHRFLGNKYSVSESLIGLILQGKRWGYLLPEAT